MWVLIIIIILIVLFLTKLITSTSRLNSCILTCFSFNPLKKWDIKPEAKCKIDVFQFIKTFQNIEQVQNGFEIEGE